MSSFDVDRFCGNFARNEVCFELFEDQKSEDPEKDVRGNSEVMEVPWKKRSRKKRSRRKPRKSLFTYKGNGLISTPICKSRLVSYMKLISKYILVYPHPLGLSAGDQLNVFLKYIDRSLKVNEMDYYFYSGFYFSTPVMANRLQFGICSIPHCWQSGQFMWQRRTVDSKTI